MHYIRDNLAVCGFLGIGRREEFETHRFAAQLQCAEPFDPWLRECMDVKSLPFDDGAPIPKGVFHEAQKWLLDHWNVGSKILISCAGGQSRSVTMSIALLCRASSSSFLDSVYEVLSRVPEAYPHPHVLVSAAYYCDSPLQLDELMRIYGSIQVKPPYPWSIDLMQEAVNGLTA
jgi:hypothetical protein